VYETHARLAFAGSMEMLVMSRFGSFEARVSRRVQWTVEAGAFALSVTNTRPVVVAAHSEPLFAA